MAKVFEKLREFQEQYYGSVFYIRYRGQVVPFYCNDLAGRADGPYHSKAAGYLLNSPQGEAVKLAIEELQFVEKKPEFGVVNKSFHVVNVELKIQRQWKRGITLEMLDLSSVNNDDLRKVGKSVGSIRSNSFLNNIYNPDYLPMNKALASVRNSTVLARAFNNKYFFTSSAHSEKIFLGYKKWIVGVVGDDDKVSLTKAADHLREEVSLYLDVKGGNYGS